MCEGTGIGSVRREGQSGALQGPMRWPAGACAAARLAQQPAGPRPGAGQQSAAHAGPARLLGGQYWEAEHAQRAPAGGQCSGVRVRARGGMAVGWHAGERCMHACGVWRAPCSSRSACSSGPVRLSLSSRALTCGAGQGARAHETNPALLRPGWLAAPQLGQACPACTPTLPDSSTHSNAGLPARPPAWTPGTSSAGRATQGGPAARGRQHSKAAASRGAAARGGRGRERAKLTSACSAP